MPLLSSSAGGRLGWINVRDYGARGDGSTDDTAAVSAAIAALPSAGGVLYFPASSGAYVTSGGFTLATPCTVRGDGAADSTLGTVCSTITCTSATAVLFTVTALWARFEALILLNTAGTTPTAGAGIVVTNSTTPGQRVDYEALFVQRFFINIDVCVGNYWVLHACHLRNPVQYGIRIRNTQNADWGDWCISDSIIDAESGTPAAAIRIQSSGGGKITNTKINGSGDVSNEFVHGIDLAPDSGVVTSDLLIGNCSIENLSGSPISINTTASGSSYTNILISGVQTANNAGASISVVGATAGSIGACTVGWMVISACRFGSATATPIALSYVANALIGPCISQRSIPLVLTSCFSVVDQNAHGLFSTGTPSLGAGAGAGTAPPGATQSGCDSRGTITWGTGSGPAAGAQVTLTFLQTYGQTPAVSLTPRNAATAALHPYVSAESATSFTVSCGVAPAASQAAGTYSVTYRVDG